jgi:hypothetical protein
MHPEVLVISLAKDPPSLRAVREHFPAARVWPATDLRRVAPRELLELGLVDVGTLEVLLTGRKHHWEMGCSAAVGLAASTLAALASGSGPLLLCEEDCVPGRLLGEQARKLLASTADYDAAVFGARLRSDVAGYCVNYMPRSVVEGLQYDAAGAPDGWGATLVHFETTHCVLYSPAGRERVARLLQPPMRLQTDGLLSLHAKHGLLRVLVQTGERGATQTSALWNSTIQEGCLTCFLPGDAKLNWLLACNVALAFVFLAVSLRVVAARSHG